MSQPLDREGTFRGEIIEYSLYDSKTGAVGINLKARVDEQWNSETEAWDDWRQYDVVAEGTIYIVSGNEKGNKPIPTSVEPLIQYAGWSGSIEDIAGENWAVTPCQFSVKEDSYKDQTRYKINFINEYDRVPGGGNVTPERAKELQAMYGSQFRALGGNVQRNAAPPAGKLKAPVASKSPKAAQADRLAKPLKKGGPADVAACNQAFDEAMAEQTDDIPF